MNAVADTPVRRPVMGGLDVFVAALLLIGVWVLLPARWWPVDVGATLLAMLLAAGGVGLLTGQPWAVRVAKLAAGIALVTGLLLVTGLAITAGNLSGLYGPVGLGGSAILAAVALLLLPYFVVFPAAQLWILAGPPSAAGATKERSEKSDPSENEPAAAEQE